MADGDRKRLYGGAHPSSVGLMRDMPRHNYISATFTSTGSTIQYDFFDTMGGSTVGSILLTFTGTDKEDLLSAERLA